MCISADLANFQATVVVATRAPHPQSGRTMHTLLYRNAPENRAEAGRGNAMLLHFPASEPMDQANVIDTSSFPHCAEDIRIAVEPRSEGRGISNSERTEAALIFEHGVYHVVLARSAASIPDALDRIPEAKRPQTNPTLFDWYGETFPGYTLALCCFDNRDAALADPLLWWYYPLREDWLMLPAVDSHDGSPPDLDALVDMDHFVALGSDRPGSALHPVQYRDPIPEVARPFLPSFITGVDVTTPLPNADFIAPVDTLGIDEASTSLQRGFLPL